MANEQQQTQPQVAIPLPKGKKNAVQIGCICMMLSVAMYGLVFATLTSPILESVNAMGYVSLFSIFAGMGVSIMTPIGGKLGDLIGRRNIVVIPGIICACLLYTSTKAVISVPTDISKDDAIAAGKEAIADKLTGNIVKEIYVPKKIINIVMK